jgi:ABC-type multidrug transport system fused ATPase/permease subunit
VGPSGSGKSTLTDLLMGLLQPTSGRILIDDVPLTEANILLWQEQVAHVPQHIFLSDGSILENVAFGVPQKHIDVDRVREACRRAELLDTIDALPEGLNSTVGERGVRLSGGQRQRIGIARALYKQATVLILDEATSALDDAAEASIVDAVRRLGEEYTVLMIAHRLTSLRHCEVIYRVENGRIGQRQGADDLISRIVKSA